MLAGCGARDCSVAVNQNGASSTGSNINSEYVIHLNSANYKDRLESLAEDILAADHICQRATWAQAAASQNVILLKTGGSICVRKSALRAVHLLFWQA